MDRASGCFNGPTLDPRYLRDGVVMVRGAAEYADAPCPFCRNPIPAEGRGHVGRRRYVQDAFMVVPCPSEECVEMQRERQARLEQGESLKLYHQTSRAIADAIRDSGKMIRGYTGIVGGGIYFAETPRETEWKCEHGAVDGVVLECEAGTCG